MGKDNKTLDFDFDESDSVKVANNFHIFDLENNRDVVGILKEITEGNFGNQYKIETASGDLINVGSYSALNSLITDDMVSKPVKIHYEGEVK